MGTENRQRGNKNLLIVTNSAIIGAVDRKELKCLGNLHNMAMFDMGNDTVLVRMKNKTCFIMNKAKIHIIMGLDPCVQRYGTPKGNERQGYRYVFSDKKGVYSLGIKILYGFDCSNLYMDGKKYSLRNLGYTWDLRDQYMKIEPREQETSAYKDSLFIGSVNKFIAFKKFVKSGYHKDFAQ